MPASDYLLAESFGPFKNGQHVQGTDREILGQWSAYANNFSLTDIGDGRKWITRDTATKKLELAASIEDLTTLSFCCRIFPTSRSLVSLWRLRDGSSNLGHIGINGSGQVVYSTHQTGILTESIVHTSSAIPLDTGTDIEVKVVLHASAGSVTVDFNGAEDSETTGIDTIYVGTSCDNVHFNGHGASTADEYGWPDGWKGTDLIIHKASSPVGDLQCPYIPDDTAGTDSDFTPSAGNNEDNIDEIGPDEDTTYNESDGTSGHRDGFTGDGVASGDIKTVLHLARARKTGAGAGSVKLGALHSASEDQSSAKALSESYLNLVEFFDTCPSTSSAWTPAQVAAAENTIEVV